MGLGIARPQAVVERWGGRALPPHEGTRTLPHCQRGEPSTSTSELRVTPRNRTLRDGDVEVRRAPGGRKGEAGDDGVCDRDLQAEVDRRAEADLEPASQAEGDLAVERAHEGDAAGKAAADKRRQRARRETAVFPTHEGAELDVGGGREPDARQLAVRTPRDRRDHPAAGRDDERVAAAPEHGDGQLRDDADAERVREAAVDGRGANGWQRLDALL